MSVAEVLLRVRAEDAALGKVADGLEDVEARAKSAGDALGDVGRAGHSAEDGFGKAGSSAAKLAGALSLVDGDAGEAARAVADFADVGEVLSVALGAVEISAAAAAAVLAPIVVLLGTLAYSHAQAAQRAEEAAQRTEHYTEALRGVKEALTDLEGAQSDLELRAGMLTGEYTEQDKVFQDATRSAQALTSERRSAIQQERADLLAHLGALKGMATDRSLVDTLFGAGASELASDANETRARIANLDAAIAELDARERGLVTSTVQVVAAEKQAADSSKKREQAVKNRAAAEQALDETERIAASNMATIYMEAHERAAQALEDAGDRRERALLADIENTQKWVAAQQKAAADAAAAMQRAMDLRLSNINDLTRFGSAFGSAVTSGSVGDLASTLGPAIGTAIAGPVGAAVGSAVGSAVSFLEDLGAAGGASAVSEKLLTSVDNIVAGLETLPDLFAEAAPDLAVAFALQIEPVIWKVQLELIKEILLLPLHIIQGFGDWWEQMGGLQGIGQAIRDALKEWWESVKSFIQHPFGNDRDGDGKTGRREVKDTVKDAISYLMTGSYAVGSDYIPRTGLALVHQGERITPANMRAAQEGGGGGNHYHLHVNGTVVGTMQQFASEFERYATQRGVRLGGG